MKSFIFAVTLVAAFVSAASAQTPCDFNVNGVPLDVGDIIWLAEFFDGNFIPQDSFPAYWLQGDCDCDSQHLTISDLKYFLLLLMEPGDIGRGQLVDSEADTIALPSISAVPGQSLSLPITFGPSRPLNGIQFLLTYDPVIISQAGFRWSDTLNAGTPFAYPGGFANYKLAIDTIQIGGTLGWLDIRISEDISGPIETAIEFEDNPRIAKYTGLSMVDTISGPPEPPVYFIRPIKIDGRVTITPTPAADRPETEGERTRLLVHANPANLEYQIEFFLPSASLISLELFNVLGQRIDNLGDGMYDSGWHRVAWVAQGVPSGVYFCRLLTEDERITAKVTLLK